MMTYRAGAARGSVVSQGLSEYYFSDTLRAENMRAAMYYGGRHEQADSFWDATVLGGRLEMGQHHAELRPGFSAALAGRLGIDSRSPSLEQVANLLSLKRADGENIEGRKKHSASADGKRPPLAFVDLTLSAPKSLSCAWGLSPNPSERDQLLNIHRVAVAKTMEYVAEEIGFTQRGGKKNRRSESGEIGWLIFQHYTSRPVGQQSADPQLHSHCIVLPHVLTDGGHIGALDLDRLNGRVHEFGYVYQAYVAAEARKLGIRVDVDERATVKLADIPEHIVDLFSKRHHETAAKAQEQADKMGLKWAELSDEQKYPLLRVGAYTDRTKKDEINDLASWSRQADEAGYRYESTLGRVPVQTEMDAPIPEPEPIDELSRKLVEAITEALRYTDPKDQADRLIWEVDEIVLEHKEAGAAPIPRLAQELFREIKAALMTAEPERALIEGTGEAIRQHDARSRERQERVAMDEQRRTCAYETALPRLQEEFRRRAVLDGNELRRVGAQALVTTGIKNAGADIDAVMKSYRKDGVDHEGQRVALVEQEALTVRGKPRVRVTTDLHVAEEKELIGLALAAASDRSAALSASKVEAAARAFLSYHPEIDRTGSHWEAQRAMIDHLATGGRLGVVIGVPGSGKSFGMAAAVRAWKEDGRSVYGISLAWRQAGDLASAGIGERASIAAFLKRVESGRYELDRNSVVVVDEVGLVGSRQMLDLLRIQERTGAQMVMIGDPRQSQPIEGASGLELLRAALGEDAIPRLLKSVRQDSEREREIAALFRRGQAAEALDLKQEDGTAVMVPGGREATIQRVAELWRERIEAHQGEPGFTLSVSAPTNADARAISVAIREEWRRAGHLGEDSRTIRAVDRTGETYDMPLAVGDRIRLYERVYAAPRQPLANNGDIVELRQLRGDGMIVRNAAGVEGLVPWDKIRSGPDASVRLAYGYATTIDVAQGSTVSEHVTVLPSGSQASNGFKAYTAATRHREINWLIIDEVSERRAIEERSMLGHRVEISERDLWQNVANNLARYPQKPTAISVGPVHQPQRRAA